MKFALTIMCITSLMMANVVHANDSTIEKQHEIAKESDRDSRGNPSLQRNARSSDKDPNYRKDTKKKED